MESRPRQAIASPMQEEPVSGDGLEKPKGRWHTPIDDGEASL